MSQVRIQFHLWYNIHFNDFIFKIRPRNTHGSCLLWRIIHGRFFVFVVWSFMVTRFMRFEFFFIIEQYDLNSLFCWFFINNHKLKCAFIKHWNVRITQLTEHGYNRDSADNALESLGRHICKKDPILHSSSFLAVCLYYGLIWSNVLRAIKLFKTYFFNSPWLENVIFQKLSQG